MLPSSLINRNVDVKVTNAWSLSMAYIVNVDADPLQEAYGRQLAAKRHVHRPVLPSDDRRVVGPLVRPLEVVVRSSHIHEVAARRMIIRVRKGAVRREATPAVVGV